MSSIKTLWQAGKQNLSLVASEKTEAVYRCQVGEDGDDEDEDHVVKDYVDDAIVTMKMLMRWIWTMKIMIVQELLLVYCNN